MLIRVEDEYVFFETLVLLKHAEPHITWLGAPAIRNGNEVRTLNECVQAMERFKDYRSSRNYNGSVNFDAQYELAKCYRRIEHFHTEIQDHDLGSKQNILTRISYYIRERLSCFWGTSEENAKTILSQATNAPVAGCLEHISALKEGHQNKESDRPILEDLLKKLASRADEQQCTEELQKFSELFDQLVPGESKRSSSRLVSCLWMEFLAIEASEDPATEKWRHIIEENIMRLDTSPEALVYLKHKAEKWRGEAEIETHPWLDYLNQATSK